MIDLLFQSKYILMNLNFIYFIKLSKQSNDKTSDPIQVLCQLKRWLTIFINHSIKISTIQFGRVLEPFSEHYKDIRKIGFEKH